VMRSAMLLAINPDKVDQSQQLEQRLLQVAGVHEARIVAEEATAYLRIEKKAFDAEAAKAILA